MATRVAPPPVYTAPARRVKPRHPRQVAIEGYIRHLFRRSEVVFAVTGLFLFSGALVPLLLERGGLQVEAYSGNPVLRAMYSAIHAITLVLLAIRWRAILDAASRNWPTLALVILSLISVAWSADTAFSLRRALSFFGTSAFGIWLAARYDLRTMLKLLAAAMGIAAVLSFIFAVGLPSYGIDEGVHAGKWRGVFQQKNTLAQTMVLGTVGFVLYTPTSRWGRIIRWVGITLSTALIIFSTSKTALGVLMTLLVLAALYRTLRWSYTLAIPVVTAAIVSGGAIAVWLLSNSEQVLTSVGKDPTLTGRTPMWLAVIDMIQARPVFGYGYSGFWLGHRYPSQIVLERIQWETPHAHNGLLDLCLQLGLVGAVLFLAGFGLAAARSVAAVKGTRTSETLWPLLMLTFILLYNITETTLLQSNNIYWVLYAAAVFCPSLAAGAHLAPRREEASTASPAGYPPARPLGVQT